MMKMSEVTNLCWFQSRTFTVLILGHVNKKSDSIQCSLLLHSAFHRMFALWAHIFHADPLKCTCLCCKRVSLKCVYGVCSALGCCFKCIIWIPYTRHVFGPERLSPWATGSISPGPWGKWTPYAQALLSVSIELDSPAELCLLNF